MRSIAMCLVLVCGCRHLQPGEVCAPSGTADFQLSIASLERWEGRIAWVAAIEPPAPQHRSEGVGRPVKLATVIEHGAIEAVCPASLDVTTVAPSWAAFIDVNGDGRCNAPDVGVAHPEYVWPARGFRQSYPSWETLTWAPVTPDFCDRYFQ